VLVDFAQTKVRSVLAFPNPAAGQGFQFKANRSLRVWAVACRVVVGGAASLEPHVRFCESGNPLATPNLALAIAPAADPTETVDFSWAAESERHKDANLSGTFYATAPLPDFIMEPEWCLQIICPGMGAADQISSVRLVVEDVEGYEGYEEEEEE